MSKRVDEAVDVIILVEYIFVSIFNVLSQKALNLCIRGNDITWADYNNNVDFGFSAKIKSQWIIQSNPVDNIIVTITAHYDNINLYINRVTQ